MSNCVAFQTQLASIVDILVQAAVAVIDNLVDEDSVLLLRLEVAQDEMDNEELRKKIQTQNELISTRFASIMGILGKEAVDKIIKLVDETKPQLMECDQSTEHETAPENSENMLIVEEIVSEDENSLAINVEEKGEPFIVVNEEDSPQQPIVLKGKDLSEGRGGRSWVWDHFTLVASNKVQCGFCNNMLSYNKNTSGMLRHLRTRHPSVHQCGTAFIAGAASQTEPSRLSGQAELEVELDVSEGRGGRSWAWDHFTLFAPNKVQCVFCNNMLSYNKNTSGMLRHLRSRHPSVQCGTAFIAGASALSESDLEEDGLESPLIREVRLEDDAGSTGLQGGPKISRDRAVKSGSDIWSEMELECRGCADNEECDIRSTLVQSNSDVKKRMNIHSGKSCGTEKKRRILSIGRKGENPFSCTRCGKRFFKQSYLYNDQQLHSGETLFSL